jgi:hypothetical protein
MKMTTSLKQRRSPRTGAPPTTWVTLFSMLTRIPMSLGGNASSPLRSTEDSEPTLSVDLGTALAPGVLQVDGTSITVANGVISTIAAIRSVSVTLSAAQINGMFAAPVLVLPAAGPGTVILPSRILLNAVFGSAAFTGGGNVALYYGATSPPVSVASLTLVAPVLTSFSSNQILPGLGSSGSAAGIVTSALAVNQGLYVSNATGPFSGGAGCSVILTVQYQILSGVQ